MQEILAQFDAARQRMQEESVGALGTDITRSQSRARQVSFRRTSIIVCKLQYIYSNVRTQFQFQFQFVYSQPIRIEAEKGRTLN